MRLSDSEKESIILFNEKEAAATFYTYNRAMKKRLSALCGQYPGQVRQVEDNGLGGLTFVLPKKWLKVSPPRVLSPAQRKVLEEMNRRKKGGDGSEQVTEDFRADGEDGAEGHR